MTADNLSAEIMPAQIMTVEGMAAHALRKAAPRLAAFMGVLFLLSFIDRANVSFAALSMNKELGFTPTTYAWGVGFFFFGYVLFEVPSNMIVERIGARRWIAPMVIAWGLASMLLALSRDALQFYALRFLLGMAEAGLLPGLLLYMTYWFPAAWRGRIAAAITLAVPLSLVIGGPVSGLILGLSFFDGLAGLKSWQWMFVIEGIPAIVAGLLAYRLMPDRPRDARWLTIEEAKALQAALDEEACTQSPHLHGSDLIHGLLSPPVLLLGLAYFCAVLGGFGIIFWVPQIVKAFGLSTIETGFVASIPYAVAALVMGALAWFGDRTGRRILFTALPMLAGALGLAIAGLSGSPALSIAARSLAASGIYGMMPAFWTLPPAYLRGSAMAAGIAMINSIGALGGFVGPYVVGWVKETTGAFGPGLLALAAGSAMAAILIGLLARIFPRPGI